MRDYPGQKLKPFKRNNIFKIKARSLCGALSLIVLSEQKRNFIVCIIITTVKFVNANPNDSHLLILN